MASLNTPIPSPPETVSDDDEAMPLRPVTLRDVLLDCGGPAAVATELGVAITTVYDWSRKGRVPDSDLKAPEAGGTSYSDVIARMQRTGTLTSRVIRRLGRRL